MYRLFPPSILVLLIASLFWQTSFACSDSVYNCVRPIPLEENEVFSNDLVWKNFGQSFDSFKGVNAYANKPNGAGGKYQCTELIHRFLNSLYGIPTKIGMGLGDAKDLASNLAARFGNVTVKNSLTGNRNGKLVYFRPGCSPHPPVVGSIISMELKKYGHIGIVRKVEKINDSQVVYYFFEQHGTMKLKVNQQIQRTKVIFTKDKNGNWSGDDVIGWISISEVEKEKC